MTDERSIGPHEISYEADTGFIVFSMHGALEARHAQELRKITLEYETGYFPGKPGFTLVDCRKATGVTGEARKVLAEQGKEEPYESYLALYGGSFAFRAVINLVLKAVRLAGSAKLVAAAIGSEEEARTWLREQKRAWLARATASG
ncbi:MAG TPA: hypothetical protein VM580_22305 [Labilithrix sp.]|nr:hypothetical protein [Labilithrix sp.]